MNDCRPIIYINHVTQVWPIFTLITSVTLTESLLQALGIQDRNDFYHKPWSTYSQFLIMIELLTMKDIRTEK